MAFIAKLARLARGPQGGLVNLAGVPTANYNCWSCDRLLNKYEQKQYFCPCEKQVILPVESSKERNYFEMFNLKENYRIDGKALTNQFRQLIRKLHPDIFQQKSESERQFSADQSRMVNKAYRTLTSPISRAIYLLKLNGVSYAEGHIEDAQADQEQQKILMQIMELNETLDEIETSEQLEELEKRLETIMKPFERQLEHAFTKRDFAAAVKIVAKMKYFTNIDERLKDLKLQFQLKSA